MGYLFLETFLYHLIHQFLLMEVDWFFFISSFVRLKTIQIPSTKRLSAALAGSIVKTTVHLRCKL